MRPAVVLFTLSCAIQPVAGVAAVLVDCDHGGSLNRTLARLDRRGPVTVVVRGTCAETVQVRGFDGLTVKGMPGAALVPPAFPPPGGVRELLLVDSSRSVTLDGLRVRAGAAIAGIGIARGSSDVRLRNLAVEGGLYGVTAYENSQVSLARVSARDPGFATLGIYDRSDVHVEDSLFEHSTGEPWHLGIDVGSGHLTIHGTTIRNMQVGMQAAASGSIDLVDFDTYVPLGGPSEVVIESPAGTSFLGVQVTGGSSLNLAARLRIVGAGQQWGGETGGVLVQDGSTLQAEGHLEATGSLGQGLLVTNGSHASLGRFGAATRSSIVGSGRNGLVVVNNSTVSVAVEGALPTEISGSASAAGSGAKDLFCDATSMITGAANILHDPTKVQCERLLPAASEALPW